MATSLKSLTKTTIDVVSSTGSTTLSGDLTVTGSIVANGQTINPTSLGYLTGVSSDIQTQIDAKANQATTYTKTEVNLAIGAATPSFSTLTGKPTTVSGYGIIDAYTKTETDSAIQAVVGAAPAALDTLKEIADQLADDESAVSALTTTVSTKAPLESPTFTGTVGGITKAMVGLGNVDNTADASKPVSTAQQTALNLKANLASPALTGTPTAPTATSGTNTTQVATTAFVASAVSSLGQWVSKSAAYTAVAGDKIFANSSTAAFIITLPAAPVSGNEIVIVDVTNSFAAKNVTLARNGKSIAGSASDLVLDVNGSTTRLAYVNDTIGWWLV